MSEKDRDTTWKGAKYLEHVGEFEQVIRASSREEIERYRRLIERYWDPNERIPGECRASVLSDSGETTEFTRGDLESLWETLSAHLLAPESKWLKFTVILPSSCEPQEFTFENGNVATQTFETDGTSSVRTISVPVKKGTPTPVFKRTNLVDWLKHLKECSSVPFPFEFGDNFYSEEELREKGIHTYEAFARHCEETQDEERFRAAITDRDGAEIWSSISDNEEALHEEMLEQILPQAGQRGHFSRIDREIIPKEHPLEDFRRRILSDATHALEIVEMAGADSPIVEVLELGLRLATNLEAMKARERAPEVLKNPNRKRPPKGKQKHEKKTAKTRHLRAEVSRILREYHEAGNSLKTSEVLHRLKRVCKVDGDTIQHPGDAEGYTVSHLLKTVIPKLRKELSRV